MHKIHKQNLAEEDLIDIWVYTFKNWGEDKADSYQDELENTFNLLAENPYIGIRSDEIRQGYRQYHINRHIIFYRIAEEKMTYCEKQKSQDKFITFDTEYLKSINATRNEVMTGLIYWDYENTFNCESEARLKFAFDISTLASAQIRYKLDPKETLDIASGFAYPSVETLEHLANYSKLPVKLREYLQKIIGDNLFNVLSSIEHLKLPRQ